ncbi:MAG: hypothetical protein AAFY76_02210 [Cyanobacteria bacterium J06649_11]
MMIISIKDLEEKVNSIKGKNTINFNNKTYKRIKFFSNKYEHKIPETIEECSSDDLEIILVEHRKFYSIWLEKKVENKSKVESASKSEFKSNQKIIKRYRGQVYEEEILDSATLKIDKINKKRLKYRGKYID